ncbi:leucine-rich repeat-containing protein 3-like [Girardinichthys multiradiatus]|uniref:leucine-rich repeat-containing protein 3-like n=1 Tax=Girardinichthys multiradiatus TaxID=208333 RepID=UPI001FABC6D6|nr:leucine-rich repeat-containing protein 3-like [Girardinichthys multiradiatus]XP_047215614.1 leucine-rich repeat-containing protein 3-like [Girardinichthys multiradiatus]
MIHVLTFSADISLFQVSSLTGHADERLTGSQSIASFFDVMSCSLTLLVLILLIPPSSHQVVALWRRGNRVSSINACQQSEAADGGLTVRCSGLRLTQIPIGLSNHTTHLFLNNNRLSSLPAFCFSDLFLLDELDLSHNQLSSLEPGCFSGLVPSLQYLDLSSNRLTTLDPAVLGGLQVQANLSQNPWHCDCSMQMAAPQLNVDISSLEKVICQTSDLPNLGAVGLPLVLLMQDWDLCQSVRRTTDFLTLITMFLWFVMLMSYLIYYIRHNQVVARRHLEYLKFLESRDPFRPNKDLL